MRETIKSNITRTAAVAGALMAVLILAGMTFQPPGLAKASPSKPCNASGVVADATDGGPGVTLTVTETGDCPAAPLVLTAVDAQGAKTVVVTHEMEARAGGSKQTSITFTPDTGVVAYEATISDVFAATLTP